MRIGMMTDMYKPYVSGVTVYISLTKLYLERLGHEVFVFTFGNPKHDEEEKNIVCSPGLPVWGRDMQFNIRYSRSAQKLLKTMDVVHVHHPFLSGAIAIRLCKSAGIPIVFTNHTRYDSYVQIYLPGFLADAGDYFLRDFMPRFYNKIDLVLVPSASMKSVVAELGATEPIVVEPHGMELQPFYTNVDPIDRANFGFSPLDVVMVYVGRLGPEKNLFLLLNSFFEASQTCPEARLLLVGDGPLRHSLQSFVQQIGLTDKVAFAGQIEHDALPAYYSAADFFVTASVTETFGLTVIEAMASGLPVLGIDSPGVGDNIVPGETGLLSLEDPQQFAANMIRLTREAGFRKQLGQQARKASEHYDIENAVIRLLQIYQNAKEIVRTRSG